MKNFLLLLVFIGFAMIDCVVAADSYYTPLTTEQIKAVTHSSQRLVYSFAGEWLRFVTGKEAESRTVTLPFSETMQGVFHYRRNFTITQDLINKYEWQLYFLGSNYKTQVLVNGQYLYSHAGGTTPFQVRIPDQYLVGGNNTLEVIVSNELDASSTIPLRRSPYHAKVYGGIFRELYLVGNSDIYFNSIETKTFLQTEGTPSGTIQITATLSAGNLKNILMMGNDSNSVPKNPSQIKTNVEISAELRSSEDSSVIGRAIPVTVEIQANRTISIKLEVPLSAANNLRLWTPGSPNLYNLVIQLRRKDVVIDDYTALIGLYSMQKKMVDGRPAFLLNGEPFSFKVVDYVEDSEINRQTMNMAEFERDIIAIKTLGATMIRLRYTTPHPFLLSLCDKYGLFVMIELPINGIPASIIGKENYIVSTQLILREMIQAYEIHPSTLAWGICDGLEEGIPDTQSFIQRTREVLRPNSAKLFYKTVWDGTSQIDTDGFDFIVFAMHNQEDVLSNTTTFINQFRSEAERLAQLAANTVVLFDFGKTIHPTNHNGYSDPFSVEAQAKILRTCYRTLQDNKISMGIIISTFNDYQAERPLILVNNDDLYTITSGLVARNRDIRVSYQMMKSLFNDEKEPVLETGNYIPESPVLFTIISMTLLITFFVLVNSSRRFREDVIRALLRPYNFYTDIRDQRILSNAGTFTLGVLLSSTLGILLSSVAYFLRHNFYVDYILSYIIPSESLNESINMLVWIPWASFLASVLVFLLLLGAATLVIRAGSLFVKARILMSDAFVIAVWACLPLVFLLPLTMGLYKILSGNVYSVLSLSIILLVLIWCLYRILRGTSVIYDVRASRVYAVGLGLLLLMFISIALYYNTHYSTFTYIQYFFRVIVH